MTPTGYSRFAASYDRTAIVITTVVVVIMLAAILISQSAIVAVLTTGILAASWAYSPRRYEVHGRDIIVHRVIGSVRLGPVEMIRPATADDLRGTLRLWGSGGLFGYFGLYRTSTVGKCWWYVTNRGNTLIAATGGVTALVSPDDVSGFLAMLPASEPAACGALPQPSDTTALAGFLIGGVALALVAAALLYAPGQPAYSLTNSTLHIRDRFYPVTIGARDVDVSRIRVIDIEHDRDWQPTARVNGFANSRYKSGWFRVRSGARVRMYRAQGERLVLFPPKGDYAPVLLEVEQPDKFVERVRKAWTVLPVDASVVGNDSEPVTR